MGGCKVFIRSLGHIIITLPSIIYHGLIHTCNRLIFGSSEIIVKSADENTNELSSLLDRDNNSSVSLSDDNYQNKETKTIVFLHGKGGDPCNFDFIVKYLLKNKKKYNIFVPYLGDNNTTSIEDDANTLLNRLKIRNIPLDNIVLVGLSKGGLVAAYFATNFHSVNKIITISSPMLGTKMADLHWDKNVRDALGYMNKSAVDLSQTANTNRYYHIVPKYDHVITPTEVAYYPSTPSSNIYCYSGLHSHIGVTHSTDICDKIISWIEEP